MDQYKSQFGQDIDIDQFDRLKRERGNKSRKNQRRRKNKTLNKSARKIQSMVRGRQTRSLRNKLKINGICLTACSVPSPYSPLAKS